MKKKLIIFHILYYVLTLLIYIAFFSAVSLLFKLSGEADNLGAAIAVTYGLLFVMTPMITAVLMRFSLFRWYIDPFAAAEIPLFLYLGMIWTQVRRSGALKAAFLLVNSQLADDGGMGWLFLTGYSQKLRKQKRKGHQNEEKDSYSFHNRDTCIGIGVFRRLWSSKNKVSRIL